MILLGYLKSGNTWVAYMLAYMLNTVYDDYDDPGVHPKRESIRKYVKGGFSHKSYTSVLGNVLKTHKINVDKGEEKVIYIVRDPRDVMISYFFYKNNIESISSTDSISRFLVDNLPGWIEHVHKWKDKSDTIIRYEDASNNHFSCFSQLCDELGVVVDNDVIHGADEIFSLKNMYNKEKGEGDNSSFYRKGVVGDWRSYLSKAENEHVVDHAGALMLELGYDLTI